MSNDWELRLGGGGGGGEGVRISGFRGSVRGLVGPPSLGGVGGH